MNISERIEFLRKSQGISLKHLNNAIGAYRGKLTEVRNGKASLSNSEILILARELSTSTDYLLGNTDDPRPERVKKDAPAISEDIAEFLNVFRQLTPKNQKILVETAKGLLRGQ